jgi:hypothetical protein
VALATYATAEELGTYVGTRYTVPDSTAELLLRDASRLMDHVTLQRATHVWTDPPPDPVTAEMSALSEAACAQVEYWLELGVEQGVAWQEEGVTLGALQLPAPNRLAPKARDALNSVTLLYRGVATAGWE